MPTTTSWNSRCKLLPGLSTAKTSATHPRRSLSVITVRYPVAVPGRRWPPGIDGRCATVGPGPAGWVGRATARQDAAGRVPARCGKLRTASRSGNCWRCGRVWRDDARWRGCVGVGNEDGEFPSLADTIAAVRRELSAAQTAGQGQAVQFRTGPVELEFEVAVTRTRGGEGGVQIWVLTLGGKLEREQCDHAADQGDAAPGGPGSPARTRRSPTSARGPEPAGPPP